MLHNLTPSQSDALAALARDARTAVDFVGEGEASEIERLRASNAELVAALRWYVENDDTYDSASENYYAKGRRRAEAIIEKTTQEGEQ